MFAVLRATGIRKAELLGIEVEDYAHRDMTFQVLGKGNKQREVAADEWIRPLLESWLRLRGTRPGALFCAVYRNGHVDPECKPLSPSNLHIVLNQRVRNAGLPKFSLHDFRRNMATDLFDADVHIKAIMDQGGWERAETAARYDRRPKQRMRKAVTNIPSPFGDA
jgi:integrase